MIGYIFLFFLSLLLAGFFAGAETAFIVFQSEPERKGLSKYVCFFVEKPDRMITLLLVATNISIVTATASSTRIFTRVFRTNGEVVSLVFVSIVSLVFCEIVPKSIAIVRAEPIVKKSSFALYLLYWFISPFVRVVLFIADAIVVFVRSLIKKPDLHFKKEELIQIIERDKSGSVAEKIVFIRSAFGIEEKLLRDYAKRSLGFPVLRRDCKVEDVLKISREKGVLVFPVVDESGEPIGVVELVDIISENMEENIDRFVKPFCRLSRDLQLKDVLSEIDKIQPICTLVNENGQIDSYFMLDDFIETLEDILITSRL